MLNKFGKPSLTDLDDSNPWWGLLQEAVKGTNGKLARPEIFPASTDARYFRDLGLPAFGFSPVLLHDHNEVSSMSTMRFSFSSVFLLWLNARLKFWYILYELAIKITMHASWVYLFLETRLAMNLECSLFWMYLFVEATVSF